MIRWLLIPVMTLCLPAWAGAATEPRMEVELSAADTIPGRAITLRITVLVPTWMPQPVDFPNFDRPNLAVTLPERATGPTSGTVDGEMWSGVRRTHRIMPLAPGKFELAPQPVVVTFRDPETGQPVRRTLRTRKLTFTAALPEGAEGLDPFIAARNLTLEQTIEGDPESLRQGDSFRRTVTATIEGSSSMFLPAMLDTSAPAGIAAYGEIPRTMDSGDRGVRREAITYVAEAAVSGELPAVSLRWYDLDSGGIRTSTAEAIPIRAKGSPPLADWPAWARLLVIAGGIMAVGLLLYWMAPRIRRSLEMRLEEKRRREDMTGAAALRAMRRACRERDYPRLMHSAAQWHRRTGTADDDLRRALLQLGVTRFSAQKGGEATDSQWQQVEKVIDCLKPRSVDNVRQSISRYLPPLNPR